MNYLGKLLIVLLIIQTTGLTTFPAFAQDNTRRQRFYVGVDGGLGLLKLSRNNLSPDMNSCIALGFYGGFIPFPWLRTGVNLNGWTIESYGRFDDDPSKGISISNFYGQIQVLPLKKTAIYANISGGFSNYINMHVNEYNAKGSGGVIGLGYERPLYRRICISLKINYGFGRFNNVENVVASVKNQHYNVTEFLIGIIYH